MEPQPLNYKDKPDLGDNEILSMIKNYKYIIMGLLSLLFHCNSIKVNEIKDGKNLEKAEVSTVDFFFQNRMKNSIKKIIGHNWEILYESGEYVYFGFTKGSSWDDLYVEKLFRVDKPSLVKAFSGYKVLTGIEINRTAYNSVPVHTEHQSTLSQDFQKKFSLSETGIEIDLVWTYSADGAPQKSKRFLILIDKGNGKFLNYKEMN